MARMSQEQVTTKCQGIKYIKGGVVGWRVFPKNSHPPGISAYFIWKQDLCSTISQGSQSEIILDLEKEDLDQWLASL